MSIGDDRAVGGTADLAPLGEGAAQPYRRRRLTSPGLIAVVTVTVAVLVAVAVVVPMKLSSERSLSSSLHGVFSAKTVRFVLRTTGTRPLKRFVEVVTLSSASHVSLSRALRTDAELSVDYNRKTFGEVFASRTEMCLRLNVGAIDRYMRASGHYGFNLRRILDRAAANRRFHFLRALAAGGWVGVKLSPLERLARLRIAMMNRGQVPKARQVRKELGSSFAETWREVVSLTQHSAGHHTSEYSDSVPVRAFARTFAKNLGHNLVRTFPLIRTELPMVLSRIDRIPNRLSVPVHLWVRGGSLIKVAVSYRHRGVAVAISHPAPLRPPAHVTFVRLPLLRLLQWLSAESSAAVGSGMGMTVPVVRHSGWYIPAHRGHHTQKISLSH